MENNEPTSDLFGNSVLKSRSSSEILEGFEADGQRISLVNEMQGRDSQGTSHLGEYYTTAKFKPTSILKIDKYVRNGQMLNNDKRRDNLLNQNGNGKEYNGYLSPGTKRNVTRVLDNSLTAIEVVEKFTQKETRVNATEVLPTFITLTLPSMQVHSDNDIKKYLLDPMLTWLKQSSIEIYKTGPLKGQPKGFGVKGFFWRAEPQKNGNIHFHIICDRYIPWQRIRQKWNALLENLEYVTMFAYGQMYKYRNGFKVDKDQLRIDAKAFNKLQKKAAETRRVPDHVSSFMDRYLETVAKTGKQISPKMVNAILKNKQKQNYDEGEACGWTNPNTMDVHRVKNLKSISAYVVKYVTKAPTKKELKLKENQELKYNETLNKECIYTYTEVTDPDTGYSKIKEDYEIYEPEFEERRIKGRIWGCSENLKSKSKTAIRTDKDGRRYYESKKSFTLKNTDKQFIDSLVPIDGSMFYMSEDGRKYHVAPPSEHSVEMAIEVKPHYELNYFERILEERGVYKTEWTPHKDSELIISSEANVLDPEAKNYVDTMIEVIGKDRVDKIADKIGDSFKAMNGKFIPLDTRALGYPEDKDGRPAILKHITILRDCAPRLAQDYEDHYSYIYECMYGKLAA